MCVCSPDTKQKHLGIALLHHNTPLYSGSVVDELHICCKTHRAQAGVLCVHTWINVCRMEN